MKKFVETVVGGAIGVIALYIVGKIAYEAGQEMARTECRYRGLQEKIRAIDSREDVKALSENPIQVDRDTEKEGGRGLRGLFGRKASVVGRFVKNPEAHMIEASVEGDEIHLNVKQKTA